MRSLFCCPRHPEEQAEAYCLRRLPDFRARTFEDHYLLCGSCAETLEHTVDFVEGMRAACPPSEGRLAS